MFLSHWGEWRHYGWYATEKIAREVAEQQARKYNANFFRLRKWQWESRVNPDTIPAA